jgi:hypothetical protein
MRKLALALVSMAAVACGGISSKEDAAKALGSVAQAGSSAKPAGSLTVDGITVNVKGVPGKSGTVDVDMTINGSDTGGNLVMTMTFHNFSGDGVATLDGTMKYTVLTTVVTSGATITMDMDWLMEGKVTLSGTDHDGEVETNIHMISSASVTGANTSNVSVAAKAKLKGTVTADGNAFTFDNEEFVVAETTGG